jgi:hypothetical protein
VGALGERLGAAQHDERARAEQRRRLDGVRERLGVAIGAVVAELRDRPAVGGERALDVGERALGQPAVELAAPLLRDEVEGGAPGAQKSSMIWS